MTITIDGSLADWTEPSDHLENSLNQDPNYEVYGRFEGGTFYFALSSPVAIGAGTTFWLITDSNPTNGVSPFGAANTGTEFNVNFDSSGVPHLYTGDAGQTFISDLTYAASADGKIVEIALPRALLGATVDSVGALIDVNDTTFLPMPYSEHAYTILDHQFDGVINGTPDEWTPQQRLDDGSITGYEIYGKYGHDQFGQSEFMFALKSDIVIGPNTTFWLDTDNNAATGWNPFPGAGTGAEYNVNIGADGVARLYTTDGGGDHLVGNIQYALAADGKSIEFAVPRSFIGAHVTTINMRADVNDTKFLPDDYSSSIKYTVSKPSPTVTSDGGGDNAAVSIAENTTAVTTVTATDADAGTKTYSIAGGADSAKFSIDGAGALSFVTAPNFEFKADAGANGVYDVVVKVTDGDGLSDTQSIAVTVTNVNEAPIGLLIVPTVSVEAGSTQKVLGLSPLIDPEGDTLTYQLKSLTGGSLFLANGSAVSVNQVLTQAQFLALTYSSPQSAGDKFAHFDVSDGTNNTDLTVDLHVTAGVSKTYTGTAGVNRLDGAAGNDTINGLGGADTMIGGTGKDKYIVDNAGDRVDERGGNGIDTVQSSVTYSLGNTARVFGAVENLTLSGAKAINGTGNALANTITGNAVVNVLNGGLGSDKLNGMLGKDTLVGGKGNDFFVFTTKLSSANIDKITDFHNAGGDNDTFQLDNAVFTKLGAVGHLKSAFFFNGTSAHDGDDHIIYNKASGALFYDSDGIGGHAQVQFATLTNHVTLTASDFNVI